MATIYSLPQKYVKTPVLDWSNVPSWKAEEERYLKEVKAFLLGEKKGKNVGEIIRFPMADSSASYMVASMRPLVLVHLEIGDKWNFQYAHLLTTKEVQEKIDQAKAMDKLFGHK